MMQIIRFLYPYGTDASSLAEGAGWIQKRRCASTSGFLESTPAASGKGMHSPNPAFPEFPNWPTPPNSPPANHRGRLPPPNSTLARVAAHGRTNLLHRGHTPPPQPPVTRVTAHGEMQELVKGCKRP